MTEPGITIDRWSRSSTAMPVTTMPVTAMPVTTMPVQVMPVTAMPVTAMPVQVMPVTAMPVPAMNVTAMPVPGQGFSTFFEVPTQIMVDGLPNDNELSLTLIGGTVCSVLLLMVCIVAVLLWILYRQKGSYVTNELDEEGTYQDEEYVDIEMQQQSQIPLAAEEDE